jgi:5-methylcytosine-specific restriction endonuclease McrA
MANLPSRPCAGCAGTLPEASGQGRIRKWCVDACRVAYLRRGRVASTVPWLRVRSCASCGGEMVAGRDGWRFCSPTCQRNGPPRESACRCCGERFVVAFSRSEPRVTCSAECSETLVVDGAIRGLAIAHTTLMPEHPCRSCGELIAARRGWAAQCGRCQVANRRAMWRRKNAVRRGAGRSEKKPMTIAELGARDGWKCHICRRHVDRRLSAPDPWSPTFDHLIPVSDGGSEEPENLALAHWHCNSSRGAGGSVQLLLVG